MTAVERSALVAHPAPVMYSLVADIERYPAFLPWCSGVRIEEARGPLVLATIEIDFHGVRQRFTTRNLNKPFESISLELVEGSFRQLRGRWTFSALSTEACKIEFSLHYEVGRGPFQGLMGSLFDTIVNSMVDAFVRRAETLKGTSS